MSEYSQSSYAQTAPAAHSAGAANHGAAPAAPSKKIAIFAIVGSVIALVGSMVNWVISDAEGATGGIKGIDGDGIITLIIALVAAILFIAAMVTKKAALYLVGGVLGLVMAIVAVINMADPERLVVQKLKDDEGVSQEVAEKAAEQAAKLYEMTAGPGLYMVLIGAVVALALGVLGFMKARAAR
ncbi:MULTISPECIES: hypothetical protein [Streptomyces]|uniref:Uncharacterized protein n=1 Tax=Streptomyces malaysiensis TaxID=92644 RepID=A0ABX6W6D2_STRMQ|nr:MULTISPECIES: hypothetical protein [Streptomyces]MCC4319837.1 hypothetical protein [Streptomyces malaysiensis]MYU13792.1 hypothetical protein [Streptomyces sp. SID8361]AUA13057.1 hypothetical protein CFP59_05211 [Streptomyces sp. M56]MCM3805868.1 hypothetical protein [Streptomyces sp. DR7-3]MCQ6244977.1 hypothetical protein [Streptomyces malaysiensis]